MKVILIGTINNYGIHSTLKAQVGQRYRYNAIGILKARYKEVYDSIDSNEKFDTIFFSYHNGEVIDTYYYKTKNKCEGFLCTPESGEEVSRSYGCQDGFGYCFKDDTGINGTCSPNLCTSNLDCGVNQQCTFSYRVDDETYIYLTCQDIGIVELGELCDVDLNRCAEGLSCLHDDNVNEHKISSIVK